MISYDMVSATFGPWELCVSRRDTQDNVDLQVLFYASCNGLLTQATFTMLYFHFHPFFLLKTLPVHLAPFSDESAMTSHDRQSHCCNKTAFLISYQSKLFVSSCQKGTNREFECHCNEQPFNKGMWTILKCLRFGIDTKNGPFLKTHRFQIYAFSIALSKSSVFKAEQCARKAKRISFAPFSYENGAV